MFETFYGNSVNQLYGHDMQQQHNGLAEYLRSQAMMQSHAIGLSGNHSNHVVPVNEDKPNEILLLLED